MISFLSIGLLISISAQGDPSFKQLVLNGDAASARFDNESAIKYYLDAVHKNPEAFDSKLRLLRARNAKAQQLFYGDKNKAAAYEIFKDNYAEAKTLYRMHPNQPESPFALAVTAGNLALLSSAREKVLLTQDIEKNLKLSVKLDPKFAYGYLGLGIFYKEISRITFIERFFAEMFFGEVPTATLEQAEANLRKSLELDPNFIFTLFHLANCLVRLEKPDQAIPLYKRVLASKNMDMNDPLWKTMSVDALKDLGVDAIYPIESSTAR